MPIGDLLSEISGEQSSAPPSRPTTSSAAVKRKASHDGGHDSKAARARHSESGSASSIARSQPAPRPAYSGTAGKPPQPTRPTSSSPLVSRPAPPSSVNGSRSAVPSNRIHATNVAGPGQKKPLAGDTGSRPIKPAVASRPTPSAPAQKAGPPAKKGSFAETLARAKAAQSMAPRPGVIQHRDLEKPKTKKERENAKLEEKSKAKAKPETGKYTGSGYTGSGYTGSSRPTNGAPPRDRPRSSGMSRDAPKNGNMGGMKKKAADDEAEKKVKKSAAATTGYAGTARPQTTASKKQPGDAGRNRNRPQPSRGGGLLAPPRLGGRDRSREDEYDEELDDFIDYDDEEDEMPGYMGRGKQYHYASDESSDMEAGLSDIDGEEEEALKQAKADDRREQAELERLARLKQQRKNRMQR